MSSVQVSIRLAFAVFVACRVPLIIGAPTQTFLNVRSLKTVDVEAALQAFAHGTSSTATSRMSRIHGSMWRSFQALPKNADGRLEIQAVRYLVHGYFAQEHGWLINGLGSSCHQSESRAVHDASILQNKAPQILEALLAAQHAARGFSLSDAVAMAATLERLIVDESAAMLEASFGINGILVDEFVDEQSLRDVLMTFLLLFELGTSVNASDYELLAEMKATMEETIGTQDSFWDKLDEFQNEAVKLYLFEQRQWRNPFVAPHFSFEEALELVERLFHSYGKWQNSECDMMKQTLMQLDTRGFGRVPLSTFYSQPEIALYRFGESVEYLTQIGALEEIRGREHSVLIANYLAGPSNCVASSTFYSVCCLSECTRLMNELEGAVMAPSASPEYIVDLVSNLSSSSIDAPRLLPSSLVQKLYEIADLHEGLVPLHGQLFAQFLHYAFPLECQLPRKLASDGVLSPSHWEATGHTSTVEEREHYTALAADNAFLPIEDNDDLLSLQWTHEEVLPFHGRGNRGIAIATVGRSLAQVLLLAAVLRMASLAWMSATCAQTSPNLLDKAHVV